MSGLDAFRIDYSKLSDEEVANIIAESRKLRRERNPKARAKTNKANKPEKSKEPQQVSYTDLSLEELDKLIASMKGQGNA